MNNESLLDVLMEVIRILQIHNNGFINQMNKDDCESDLHDRTDALVSKMKTMCGHLGVRYPE